ncbi:MAG: type II toxin-antitoxin system VapC family toxin [Solirubrobacteraceae bacterium]
MSTVLIDTHIALWALGDPGRLTDAERSLLIDTTIDRCMSPLSVWEAAIKREAGRLQAPRKLTAVLAAEFRMLDVTAALLEQAAELPRHHADPFDRVLIAHALRDDLGVLTRDPVFADYGVRLAVRSPGVD